MHNSHQSFASRERMLNFDRDASNQVIWFTDARPARAFEQTPMAFQMIDRVAGEHAREPGRRREREQAGPGSGLVLCAGGPIEGGVFKCALKSVATAVTDGTYAPWAPGASDVGRLQQIFPTGVCDYSRPDVGRPPG